MKSMSECKHAVSAKSYFKADGKGTYLCLKCGQAVTPDPAQQARLNKTADVISIVLSVMAGLAALLLGWLLVSGDPFGENWPLYFLAAIGGVAILMGLILGTDSAVRRWQLKNRLIFLPAEPEQQDVNI